MSLNTTRSTWLHPLSNKSATPVPALRHRIRAARELLEQGALNAAQQAIEQLIAGAPHDFRVLALSAECYSAQGDHETALHVYDRLLAQQDSNVIWVGKARSLVALQHYNRAAVCFGRASALTPKAHISIEHADCQRQGGQLTHALSLINECKPADAQSQVNLQLTCAQILTEMGDKTTAFECAARAAMSDETGKAIALARQNMPDTQSFLELCFKVAERSTAPAVFAEIAIDCPHIISAKQTRYLTQTADDPTCSDALQAVAHLALFRLYDANNDGFVALAHLRRYHTLSIAIKPNYKRSYDSALFTILTRLKFEPLPASSYQVLPIFVTGLPKSGRAHAAQILEQAADGSVARSLSLVPAIMTRLIRKVRSSGHYKISRASMLNLQAELRDGLEQAAQRDKVIIDTTALNFRWSGLLAALLPEARIVQMKRDHMTTGWALHTSGSQDPTLGSQHDLKQIQAFQHRSMALMNHWEMQNIPRVIGISNDALCRPSMATARAMVEACQLNWSHHCETSGSLSNCEWQRYAAYLNPLRQPVPSPLNIFGNQSNA